MELVERASSWLARLEPPFVTTLVLSPLLAPSSGCDVCLGAGGKGVAGRRSAESLTMAPKAPPHLLTSLLTTASPAVLLLLPGAYICQASSCFRALALGVPSTWNVVLPALHMAAPFSPLGFRTKDLFSEMASHSLSSLCEVPETPITL